MTPSIVARLMLVTAAAIAVAAPDNSHPQRPNLTAVKPIAACQLQTLPGQQALPNMRMPTRLYSAQPAEADAMVNYVRSARGEWQIPPNVDRDDPWNRFLMLGPKQPLIIDIAVLIDGRPYRASREVWIDDALAAGKSGGGGDSKPASKTKDQVATAPAKKSPAADGTAVAADASKDNAPQDEGGKKGGEKPAVAEMSLVETQSRQAPQLRERLMTYLETIGPSVSRDEVRWLLAEWGSGPPLILLGPGPSWQRAGSIPLLVYLDQDGDGSLSKTEIDGLAERLNKADRDGDDVLEINEIRRATERAPAISYPTDHPLLVSIDELTNWKLLAADIVRLYAKNNSAVAASSLKERIHQPDQALSADVLRTLATEAADVTLRVDFATAEGQTSGVSLLSIGPELSRVKDAVTATADVVTLDLGADSIEISAAGGGEGNGLESGGSQVAIGAVVDGDPLLRSIDRDQDGRLTSRERQALADFVHGLDRNGDGQVGANEIPVPLRLAVTLGPQVHKLLAKPTLSARNISPRNTPAAPDWFASADLNKDGDLSRGEFIGTTEVFQRLDTDGDGRLSVAEALAAGGGE